MDISLVFIQKKCFSESLKTTTNLFFSEQLIRLPETRKELIVKIIGYRIECSCYIKVKSPGIKK